MVFVVPVCAFFASVSTHGEATAGCRRGRLLPQPSSNFDVQYSHCPPSQYSQNSLRALSLRVNDCTEEDLEDFHSISSDDTNPTPPTLATDRTDSSTKLKYVSDDKSTEAGEGNPSDIHRLLERLLSLKQRLYLEIRRVLAALVTIITRSTQKTQAWVRDDVAGQLLSSALALVLFFAGVAAFAAWNVEVLGGKKWAGPAAVTVPVVRLPDAAATAAGGGGVRIQKAQWRAPEIRTSYTDNLSDKSR